MRKIAIAAAVSLSLTGVTGVSHALGLGEIEMYSALNEALDAEITILSATEEELRSMQVNFAPAAAFARAGLMQLPVLSTVSFSVESRPDGQPVVKVTSDGPVVEPFLNFLIEVDSPGSVRLVREYTVLLNPPTFTALPAEGPVASVTSYDPDDSGVKIDLTNASVAGVARAPLSDTSVAGSMGQVTFSEIDTDATLALAEPFSPSLASDSMKGEELDLFLPDDQIFESEDLGNAVIGRDGEVISLVQEFSAVPQFDEPQLILDGGESLDLSEADESFAVIDDGSSYESIDISEAVVLADTGRSISLANLGAEELGSQEAVGIFGNDFADDGDVQVIKGAELASFVEPLMGSSVREVEYTEAFSQSSDDSVFQVADYQTPAYDASSTFANEDSDADGGLGYGDPIDLTGIVVRVDESARGSSAERVVTQVTGETYRVQSQDTLWRIANQFKAPGVTPHQMMVALLNANQSAFANGNMNRMSSEAVLEIPTADSQRAIERDNALAIVTSWTRGNGASAPRIVTTPNYNTTTVDNTSANANNNLEDLDRRMEIARSELESETIERDGLQGRVNTLEDSMSKMKGLITLREDELNQVQGAVEAAEYEVQTELANQPVGNVDEIARLADVEKNLLTAEAEAQSFRLSSEEDALRAQLAQLQSEKLNLAASSQIEKAELVRLAELEKANLLAQAKAERERIMAGLESEKARISEESAAEIARILGNADNEKQLMLADAEAERARLAAETEEMQSQLQEMQVEKDRLLAEAEVDANKMREQAENDQAALEEAAIEQNRLAEEAAMATAELEEKSLVQDRLDRLQAESEKALGTDAADDMDADGGATETGKKLAAGGAAAVSGLLAVEPLQGTVGSRKTILGVGAGLSLLGLLAAWGFRRRKSGAEAALRPMANGRRPVPAQPQPSRTNFDDRKMMHGNGGPAQNPRHSPSRSASAAPAAQQPVHAAPPAPVSAAPYTPEPVNAAPVSADTSNAGAGLAAAAVAGTAAVASTHGGENQAAQVTDDGSHGHHEQAAQIPQAAEIPEPAQIPQAAEIPAEIPEPAQIPQAPEVVQAPEIADVEHDETALDDTITEAEVYMRYGLHGQAEDLLKTAVKRSPNNEEYHFKLLENYHDQKDVAAYQDAAASFNQKFSNSEHHARINAMGKELGATTNGDSSAGGIASTGAAAAGAAALGAGALMASAKDSAAGGIDSALGGFNDDAGADSYMDQTIDPGAEFSVDELQATGNLNSMLEDSADFDMDGNMSLDDVDLASLDDDGTMNLEAVAGSQMSGLELGSLDLTNPDVDGTFDNLTLDDANINSLGNVTGDLRSGLDADLPVGGLSASNVGGSDEMESQLDLAKALMDIGDSGSAEKTLRDVAARGNPLQQIEASELLKKLS